LVLIYFSLTHSIFTFLHFPTSPNPAIAQRWTSTNPTALATHRVTFTPHDFFTPQSVFPHPNKTLFPESEFDQPAGVFLLKNIVHDWADAHARRILEGVRRGAWKGGRVGVGVAVAGRENGTGVNGGVKTRKRKVSRASREDAEGEEVEYEDGIIGAVGGGGDNDQVNGDQDQDQDGGREYPPTKLIVLDMLAPYACRVTEADVDVDVDADADADEPTYSTAGTFQPAAPEPLLPNYGGAWSPTYNADLAVSVSCSCVVLVFVFVLRIYSLILSLSPPLLLAPTSTPSPTPTPQMLTLVNGQERTLAHTRALFASAGWKLTRVHQSQVPGFHLALLEAEAV
jgi:hypothetical protein